MALYRMAVTSAFAIGSKRGVNTWHLRTPFPFAPGPTGLVTAIKNFYDALKASVPTTMSWSFDGTLAEIGTDAPQAVAALTPWTVTGTVAGSAYMSAGVGYCVGWRSSLTNRHGRGRTFISPLSAAVSDQADGTIVDSHITTARTAANTLVSASLADGNGALVVWSPTTNLGHDFTSAKINDKVAWLSSRRH